MRKRMFIAVIVHLIGLTLIMVYAPSFWAAISWGAALSLVTVAVLSVGVKREQLR